MNEQKPEQTSGEPGVALIGEPAASNPSNAQSAPVAMQESMQESEAGSADVDHANPPVPELGETTKMPEVDAPKADAQGSDTPKPDAPEAEGPRIPGEVVVLSSGDRARDSKAGDPQSDAAQTSGMFGKRRLAALAAGVALAVLTGAIGGALATVGLKHFAGDDAATSGNRVFEASIARIDAEIAALKDEA